MSPGELFNQIRLKRSYLCIGLDTDITKLPSHLLKHEDPVAEFNRHIIEATQEYCVAYKPNLAFYESLGPAGLQSLQKTMAYIPENIFTIADAKRGDIGNTSAMYARAFFEFFDFDAVTVTPYMGEDSVKPFLEFSGKWVILLALTSNKGANDFQGLKVNVDGKEMPLYESVITKSIHWGDSSNMMFVIGATRADHFYHIRKLAPDHFMLVPGVGAQGGSLREVSEAGMNSRCGLLVNSSREILYASSGEDFVERAAAAARKLQQEMEIFLDKKQLLD